MVITKSGLEMGVGVAVGVGMEVGVIVGLVGVAVAVGVGVLGVNHDLTGVMGVMGVMGVAVGVGRLIHRLPIQTAALEVATAPVKETRIPVIVKEISTTFRTGVIYPIL